MPRIAIAGNPNAGKTSLFNHLTGAAETVSNYPGVTVECKEGRARVNGQTLQVIDLPGSYSLTAYSQEEVVARNIIIEEEPDVVVDVVDASNLERNLYLTVQLMEMRVPLVIALNMTDVAEDRGIRIDERALSDMLGVPVVPTCGNRGRGAQRLLAVCAEVVGSAQAPLPKPVTYGHEVSQEVDALAAVVATVHEVADRYEPSWIAVKLIEGDSVIEAKVRMIAGAKYGEIDQARAKAVRSIETHFGEEAATIIAERRYGFAAGAAKACSTLTGEARQNLTDQIDSIACNRFLGPVILVGVVAALFFSVFKLSDEWRWIPWLGGRQSPTGLMEELFAQLSLVVAPLREGYPILHSLLDDALIGGVGGVMSFVPLIFIMFMFVSALEDTGYIARVAFILDRALRLFGLQGKSIFAMIVSGGLGAGGCAVVGVMATRTLREEKDRLVTMLVAPFMNCGAKMPVYAMLIAAFFPAHRTRMMLILWGISWVVALFAALLLRKLVVRGEQTPFVMELPPYHMPMLRGVLRHTWERTWLYIRKAATIILVANLVLWLLMAFPRPPAQGAVRMADAAAVAGDSPEAISPLGYSFAGRLGRVMEPVTQLAGLDWRTNIALIGGVAAKEVIIGTLGTVYSMGDMGEERFESLSERLAHDPGWNPLRAFALMIFVMVYAPCLATTCVMCRESGSGRWAVFSTVYSTVLAFLLAAGTYQAGRLLGLG